MKDLNNPTKEKKEEKEEKVKTEEEKTQEQEKTLEEKIKEEKKQHEFANYENQFNKSIENMIAQELDAEMAKTANEYEKKVERKKEEKYKEHQEKLKLIPKYCDYLEYMLNVLRFLPRIEKFNIGNDFKNSMYNTLENIIYLDKIEEKNRLFYLNKIDAGISYQRILLRIMVKHNWISIEKFNIVMLQKLAEVGRITGGLIKYYAKNLKK